MKFFFKNPIVDAYFVGVLAYNQGTTFDWLDELFAVGNQREGDVSEFEQLCS
jgi:hypothetical protein